MLRLFLIQFFLLLAVHALPTAHGRTETVVRRMNDEFKSPKQVTTHHTSMTPLGPMTEVCEVVLTPITLKDGIPAVEEVRTCRLVMGDVRPPSQPPQAPPQAPPPSPPPAQAPPPPPVQPPPEDSSRFPPPPPPEASPSSTVTDPAAAPTGDSGLVVNGVSSVPASPAASPEPTPQEPAPSPPPQEPAPPPPPAPEAQTSSSAPPAAEPTPPSQGQAPDSPAAAAGASPASGTAAAAEQTSAAPFDVPGKKLSVLPIGLGVFAGISVIALIVVGLVTYERTKYRKAFRQRKLAEAGASMGYGGMAQRV